MTWWVVRLKKWARWFRERWNTEQTGTWGRNMKQEHQRATQDLRHGHQPKRSDNERRSGVSVYIGSQMSCSCVMVMGWWKSAGTLIALIARVETPTRAHPHMCKQQWHETRRKQWIYEPWHCQCLMLTVCTKGLSNAISILCMYVLYMWKNWQ